MVDRASPDLFDDDTLPSTTQQVLRLALPSGLEHFDELRGRTPNAPATPAPTPNTSPSHAAVLLGGSAVQPTVTAAGVKPPWLPRTW
ncbi:hypothetical protein DW355_11065 [Hylemonella gracilis]|uniref:Uncharacterized protein n=1 Tax=Hylemonella gracilis TaxID=80880 RepID=A0A4P6UL39_9BURK|nr:hypothetical protein [Hylemonella gracilis]QBK05224.1 hypothetical protein DW355_11065 [Hylemonella gracilis]